MRKSAVPLDFGRPSLLEWRAHRPLLTLGLLLVVAAGLRVAQAARLECISRDGVHYVQFAGEFASEPAKTLRAHLTQPGYPVLLLGVHWLLESSLSSAPVLAWERSGQLLGCTAGLAVVLLVYALAVRLFSPSVALAAAAMAVVWPHVIELSADVLSDVPHLAIYLGAVLVGIGSLRTGRPRSFIILGVLSGLAYLVRQEALGLPLAAAVCWLGARRRETVPQRVGAVAAMVVAFAVVVAPYAWATGTFMHKKGVGELLFGPRGALRATDPWAVAPAEKRPAVKAGFGGLWGESAYRPAPILAGSSTALKAPLYLLDAWSRSGQYVFSTLALIGLAWWRVPRGSSEAARFVLVLVVLHVVAVLLRARSFGEVSSRYMLIPVALSLPWAAAGLLRILDELRYRGWRWAAGLLPLLLLVPLALALRHPPQRGKLYLRTAGTWIREHGQPTDRILAEARLTPVVFYSGIRRYWPRDGAAESMWQATVRARPRWFVEEFGRARGDARTEALLERFRTELVDGAAKFEAPGPGERRVTVHSTRDLRERERKWPAG